MGSTLQQIIVGVITALLIAWLSAKLLSNTTAGQNVSRTVASAERNLSTKIAR